MIKQFPPLIHVAGAYDAHTEYGKLIAERTMANTPPLTAYFGDD